MVIPLSGKYTSQLLTASSPIRWVYSKEVSWIASVSDRPSTPKSLSVRSAGQYLHIQVSNEDLH